MDDLHNIPEERNFAQELVSELSVDQLIKAHELKYIEKVLEVSEEANLVHVNIEDFDEYPDDVKLAAFNAYEHSKKDPAYFDKPGVDLGLYKPVLILGNIDNKKNEVKLKGWHVDYHSRLIERLRTFKGISRLHKGSPVSWIKKLFTK